MASTVLVRLTGAVIFAACPPAIASGVQETDILSAEYLMQVGASLIFVLCCLFGLLYVLKRMNGGAITQRKGIQVLASVKVGTREKVLLVEAGDSQLLIGVAAGSVRTLHVFEEAQAFEQALAKAASEVKA